MDEDGKTIRERYGNRFALEVCFLAFVGLIVVLAFFEALTYALVSARTPLVIMVPLLILIVIHAVRLYRNSGGLRTREHIVHAVTGGSPHLKKVVGISGWMLGLVAIITVLGHYAGVFLFCTILMRALAGESWKMTLLVAAAATLFIFGVFEYVFNIDLYRGVVIRYFLGYRDF